MNEVRPPTAVDEPADPVLAAEFLRLMDAALAAEGVTLSAARRARLARLGGASRSMGTWIARHPRIAARVARSRPDDIAAAAVRAGMRRDLRRVAEGGDVQAFDAALRRARHAHMSAIALHDIEGRADLATILDAISEVADAALEESLRVHRRRCARRLALADGAGDGVSIVALGKLGGRELNFCSDIDIMVVYARSDAIDAATERALYTKIAEGVGASLGTVTAEGFVFRVDFDLRPEGRSGPLVNSIDAAEAYYEAFGRHWERMALAKARHAAGNEDVTARFIERVRPFVFPRHVDMGAVHEIGAMKAAIEAERPGGAGGDDASSLPWNLKMGAGGIRDIEFVVGAHQLVTGGRDPAVRATATMTALTRLVQAGRIDAATGRQLLDAYRMYRRGENRIQMQDERQDHVVPAGGGALAWLARASGYPDGGTFVAALSEHRTKVREVFRDSFPEAERGALPGDPVATAVVEATTGMRRGAACEQMGLDDPAKTIIERLRRRPGTPFSPHAPVDHREFAARVVAAAAAAPDPTAALARVESLIRSLGGPAFVLMLRDRPKALRALVRLFGTSGLLSTLFVGHPELLDTLLLAGRSRVQRGADDLAAELRARLDGVEEGGAGRPEVALAEMVRFRNQEMLRIGLSDVGAGLDLECVLSQLTDLAEVVLGEVVARSQREVSERYGTPIDARTGGGAPMVVLAAGRMGGREMGYRSDLDILFVYDGEGISTGGSRGQVSLQEYFARVAQRVIATLTCRLAEGALYSADTALRPSGNQGVLVTSWDGFLAYHRERAQTWERQSLVRMRPVAGDAGLGRRVLDEMVSVIFAPGPDPGPAVARMRARIEEERAGGHHVAHVKLGRGGLTDIEFTAQVLQLRHAGAHPPLRWVGTFEALRRARDAGFLAADDADFLVDALRFLRRLEICLRILRDVSVTALPIQPGAEREMDAIARRMDLPDGGALLRRYRDVTEGVRERYLRHVTGTAA